MRRFWQVVLVMVPFGIPALCAAGELLSAADRFCPALKSDSPGSSPVVSIRHPSDAAFGADVRAAWDEGGLMLEITVVDPTPGPAGVNPQMWNGDSVQVAFDVHPEVSKGKYADGCFELGFSLVGEGEVLTAAFCPAEFSWAGVEASGQRIEGGWRLSVCLPWSNLGLEASKLPTCLGVNVLVNDGQGSTQRRYVEWTPGIGSGKHPDHFARLVLVTPDQISAARLLADARRYDRDRTVNVAFVEYACKAPCAEEVALVAVPAEGEPRRVSGPQAFVAAEAGTVRRFTFTFPAGELADEGDFRLTLEGLDRGPSRFVLPAFITRVNEKDRLAAALAPTRERLAEIDRRLKSDPTLASDEYVQLARAIVERFAARIPQIDPANPQPPEWSAMQIEELGWVLDGAQRRLDRLAAAAVQPFTRPETPATFAIRDGQIVDEAGRPFFFYGYGHLNTVDRELTQLPSFATSLVQVGRDPRSLHPDGSLRWADIFTSLLPKAAGAGMKVDLLLAPHIMPEWAGEGQSGFWIDGPSFIKYNIDHPEARRIIRLWFETIIPHVRDLPALFGFCLDNEPAYDHSGRDAQSRPRWMEFLEAAHGEVSALNALYGTEYGSFDEVPVPEVGDPNGVGPRRAYYDWLVFNREHFTGWHEWLNGMAKSLAPDVPTHVKIIPVLERAYLETGIDVERVCRFSDLGGNDASAYWTPEGPFVYEWQHEQIWNDLLFGLGRKPVYNSENHLIPDQFPEAHVPPEHTHAVLVQGGLHHQYATAIWLWQEPNWITPFAVNGSIYVRPANLFAAGRAMLDLNRLAAEVSAVNAARPRAAILYAIPSLFWDEGAGEAITAAYMQLTFLGQPVGFVSERQLAEGDTAGLKVILCPQTGHVEDATVEALARFAAGGGTIVRIGSECLRFDQYHRLRELPGALAGSPELALPPECAAVSDELRSLLDSAGVAVAPLVDVLTDRPVWGVEYRVVSDGEAMIVPMINFLTSAQTVRLDLTGAAVDLIAEEPVDPARIELSPMCPRLIRIVQSKEATP
ncbi:MAG: hypothetical protein GXY33_11105 [Phycisphaerae bacterium]|nr:hypothetical protein [Phycisphaerae bacterium]